MSPRPTGAALPWMVVALVAAATAFAYAPVVGHEFLNFDDMVLVVDSPTVTAPATPSSLLAHFRTPYHGNWLPIYWTSLHLTHALHGANPAAFLLTNLAIHLLSVLLLFAALHRMSGQPWPSVFVAAVFALHPLHVESVAWITERKNVLAGFFWMSGLYAHARYAEKPGAWLPYAALLSCFALGLLSKSTVITFPFVLLLLDHWPLDRLRGSVGRRLLEKTPLFAIALVAVLVTYTTQAAGGQMKVGAELTLVAKTVNAIESWCFYARDALWPVGLAPLYPHPYTHLAPTTRDLVATGGLAALLLGATAACAAQWRKRPYLGVGWLWYLGTLVPMIGIVQVGLQARADRYTYIPLTGLAIVCAWSAAELTRGNAAARRAVAAAAVVSLVAAGVATRQQLVHWQDTISLYERVVAVTERNGYAHEALAYELAAIGRNAEAADHFAEAARVNPGRVQSFFGLAVTRRRLGETEAAITAYRAGLRLNPQKIRAHGELGVLLVEAGRHQEAIPHLDRALEALPNDPEFRRARDAAGVKVGVQAEVDAEVDAGD